VRAVGSWIAGVALAVLAVGLGVVLLATPPLTRALAERSRQRRSGEQNDSQPHRQDSEGDAGDP